MGTLALCGCKNTIHPLSTSVEQIRLRRMACEGCAVRFSILKPKKRCRVCLKNFCSACAVKEGGCRYRYCQTCSIFVKVPFERAALMKLRVAELRRFLEAKHVPIQLCTEKKDLVDLILQNYGQNAGGQNAGRTVPTGTRTEPAATTATSTTEPMEVDPRPETNVTTVPVKLTIENVLDRDPETLTIRQLKEVLVRSHVNIKGCVEKYELIEKLRRLQKEVTEDKGRVLAGLAEEMICKICMNAPIDCVLLECGHMLTCIECGKVMNECPVCRQFVIRVVKTFRS